MRKRNRRKIKERKKRKLRKRTAYTKYMIMDSWLLEQYLINLWVEIRV